MSTPVRRVNFDFIEPLQIATAVRGVELVFSPLLVGEVPGFSRAIEPLLGLMPEIASVANAPEAQANELLAAVLFRAVADQGPAVIRAVAITSRQPLKWVEDLRADELVALASLAIEVNADFFQRAMPGIKAAGKQARAMVAPSSISTGPTPSSC